MANDFDELDELDDPATPALALDLVREARDLVSTVADVLLPDLRRQRSDDDDVLQRELVDRAAEQVASAWASLAFARTLLQDLKP